MEDVGPQVVSPMFIHRALSGRFCESPSVAAADVARKRDCPYNQSVANHQLQQQHQGQQFHDPGGNWNPSSWDWDSVRFVAKPAEQQQQRRPAPQGIRLGGVSVVAGEQNRKEEVKKGGSGSGSGSGEEDDECLRLNLGGGLKHVDEPVTRPNKRVRSGSPGGNYPMCQVDDCSEDLSGAKDYHRRHKVCEVHSKSAKALVGKQMQRFCQQCSRFHLLSEFDEGKRSCRRRLAGHNRRRRKTQADDVNSRVLVSGSQNSTNERNLDLVNLLTAFTHAQGKVEEKCGNITAAPNNEHVMQILSKINSLPMPMELAAKLPAFKNLNAALLGQLISNNPNKLNVDMSSQSTADLLAILSATLAASAPDALAALSQKSSPSSDFEATKSKSPDRTSTHVVQKGHVEITSVGGERSSTSYQSPIEDSDCQVQEVQANLPLQLFGSSPEDEGPPRLANSRKYYSSDSSNPIEEPSPSSSPIVKELFPMQSSKGAKDSANMSLSRVNLNVKPNKNQGQTMPLELFRDLDKGLDHGHYPSPPYQNGYTSSSGSDQSLSSLNIDAQERTGRIMFKLFDKDPSHFPGTLRSQIFNWLSSSPIEMESYIRPGCVVLTVYLSMPCAAWKKLEENLIQQIFNLLQNSESDFWRSGRFLVCTGRKLASHNNGKVHLCKSWSTNAPELISVSPLAVVGGQEASIMLRGRNLNCPGTKVHCAYMGGYISRKISELSHEGSIYDGISLHCLKIHDPVPNTLGRCFIEVENGLKGNSFPVIIADATICSELRQLESELEEGIGVSDTTPDAKINKNDCRLSSREEVLHFLNELGWLFQRTSSTLDKPDYPLRHYKYVFTFAVERDCCAVVKRLLDLLLESNLDGHGLSSESLESLSEIQLLNRAVRRRCKKMIDMLIHFNISSGMDNSRTYLFPPNLAGPGGITPLHLAACTTGSQDIVDSLTNDPQEIGLNCWSSLLDMNGKSPYAYAAMMNNNAYNELVARKFADKRNGQISVMIGSMGPEHQQSNPSGAEPKSCAKCALMSRKFGRTSAGTTGLLQQPFIHSMLVIAAVCVCVCLFYRGAPRVYINAHFKWENLDFGAI